MGVYKWNSVHVLFCELKSKTNNMFSRGLCKIEKKEYLNNYYININFLSGLLIFWMAKHQIKSLLQQRLPNVFGILTSLTWCLLVYF